MIQRPAGDQWTTTGTRYVVSLAVLVRTALIQRRKTLPWYKKDQLVLEYYVPDERKKLAIATTTQLQHNSRLLFLLLVGSTLERFSLILILN